VPLALSEQGVQHASRVVDRDDPAQHGLARLRVHLGDRDMGAERERRAWRGEDRVHVQPLVGG